MSKKKKKEEEEELSCCSSFLRSFHSGRHRKTIYTHHAKRRRKYVVSVSLFGFFKRPSSTVNQSYGDDPRRRSGRLAEDRSFGNMRIFASNWLLRCQKFPYYERYGSFTSVDSNSKSTKIAAFDFEHNGKSNIWPRSLAGFDAAIPLQLLNCTKRVPLVIFTNETPLEWKKKQKCNW